MIEIKVLAETCHRVSLSAPVIYAAVGTEVQAKAAVPDFEEQVILPDGGYDYLTAVTVAPIPVTEAPNDAGGITLTVGGQNGN